MPDRKMATVTAWLREHPGVEIACRDGAGDFAQAITDADPTIAQSMDRWHLWHGLGEAAWKEVGTHSACWAKIGPPVSEGRRAVTTRERWRQVHQLLDAGVGLLDCSRRLNLALNTVKRYARHTEPEQLIRAPAYRPTLVDPYREHLRRAGPRIRPFPSPTSSARSGNSATPEARTCWSATSTRAASRPTMPPFRHARSPDSS
ncbi:hypothetical protein [Streptomyces luteireticuli]|uniref:hypothetical protein n=1 Tax=Streptomyces luteireticuli TaxID=173858 RepID=UPI003555C286